MIEVIWGTFLTVMLMFVAACAVLFLYLVVDLLFGES
jgi:hypothetical protein